MSRRDRVPLRTISHSHASLRLPCSRFGFSFEKSFVVYVLPFVSDDSRQTASLESIILDVTQDDLKVSDVHVELIPPVTTSMGYVTK